MSVEAAVTGFRTRHRFGKIYTEYEISTSAGELSWVVHKRFSQFVEFHQKLGQEKILPSKTPPRLPPLKLFGNMKDDFVQVRHAALQKYLQAIMAAPGIAGSVVALTFLGALESNEDNLAVKKKINLEKLMELAREGDLLLMQTEGIMQSLTRTVTQSKYDHVGLVIPTPSPSGKKPEWSILEATMDGVRRYDLRRRLRSWDMSKAKVVYRQLSMERTPATLDRFLEFTKVADGLAYGLNPMKLLRRTSASQKNNFFCSELVAHAYKQLGILPEGVASGSYFPSTFDQDHGLQLAGRASLGDEVWVDFNQPEVGEARRGEAKQQACSDGPI